ITAVSDITTSNQKTMIYLSLFYLGLMMIPEIQGWSYFYSSTIMNYSKARAYCKEHYTDIVAIQNREENDYLNSILPYTNKYYWIGIRKKDSQWTWEGTNKVLNEEAKNWAKGEPNNENADEDCVEMYVKRLSDSGKWNDESCRKEKVALCYIAACNASSCSGHGECIETINNYTCKCNEGFYGTQCENVKTCDPLVASEKGSFDCLSPNGNYKYGASCEFRCEEGYIMHTENTVNCTANGWTSKPPTCQVAECTDLNAPHNGQIHCAGSFGDFMYNSSCKFSCDEGFQLIGNQELQCMKNSYWNGLEPRCEAIRCPTINVPENGSVMCSHINGNFSYNSSCEFTCSEGFILKGSEYLQCTANGEWTDQSPTCQAILCERPQKPVNGDMSCSSTGNSLTENSECHFECKEGFTLVGSDSILCVAPDQWTNETPKCQAMACPSLSNLEHGTMGCVDEFGEFQYNSKCTFTCNEGFILTGSDSIQCSSSGSWTFSIPLCQAMTCPVPPTLEQGSMECEHEFGEFQYNTKCNFTCNKGFSLIGSGSIHCSSSGTWSSDVPTCQAVTCPVPPMPDQGSMECVDEFIGNEYNSTCMFTCNKGFILTGSESIHCASSGSWSSDVPTCEAVTCPSLSNFKHGSMECDYEFQSNSKCTFKCNEGFILTGSESINCSSTGSWSSDVPTCQAIQCMTLETPEYGQVQCNRGFGYHSRCTFTCSEGFKMIGLSDLLCLVSGQWTSPAPTCEAMECQRLVAPYMGKINCTHPAGEFKYGSVCRFDCEKNSVLNGTSTLECDSAGKWSAPLPTCEAKTVLSESVNMTIGVVSAATLLSTASLLIWLLKRFRKTAKKFSPSSSCQSLEAAGVYQNTEENAYGLHSKVGELP
ncbi:P-selectin isoform X2, partial [Pelobates cultripes]